MRACGDARMAGRLKGQPAGSKETAGQVGKGSVGGEGTCGAE